jgi:hypothetical protein
MRRYFKYLSPPAAHAVLANCTLRWSRPSKFNDIFDMAVPYSTDFDSEFVRRRAIELMWDRLQSPGLLPAANQMGSMLEALRPSFLRIGFDQFADIMQESMAPTLAAMSGHFEKFGLEIVEHMRTIKVLCLSTAHDHNQMWGIYASNHEGLVLEFANAEGVDSVYRVAKAISYSDRAPPLLDDEGLANFLAGNLALAPQLADSLIFLKSTHWEYEKEVRISTGDGRRPYDEVEDVPFHPRELVSVFFGARSSDLRKELEPLLIAKYPHAERWQAARGRGFEIEFTKLDAIKE